MQFDPKDIVEHLRHNLERYPYRDGFPVFRELLQNADDAEADTVVFQLLSGWGEKAENPLLKGPGLLLTNNGYFNDRSAVGMQTFGASVKALDETAVGRFGLGQKSVFHICDAFVVAPFGYEAEITPFVVNPFKALGREGDDCIGWDRIDQADACLIDSAGQPLISSSSRLNFWFPLRRDKLRPKPTSKGIVSTDIAPESLTTLADRQRLAEMLASLRHVRRAVVAINGERVELDRDAAPGMVGYRLDPGDRSFGGVLGPGIFALGRERRLSDDFQNDLRQSDNWPRSRNANTDEEEPQTATPHGAAILLIEPDSPGRLSADWSVLLPVTEAFRTIHYEGKGYLKLLLHGCFFVDSGRKGVIGVDSADPENPDQKTSNEAALRADWNRSLRDGLVLPLIPSVFHDALVQKALSSEALAAAVRALATSNFGRTHREAIAADHILARCVDVTQDGTSAHWRLVPSGMPLRPLPATDERGCVALAELMPNVAKWSAARNLTLVCGKDALFSPEVPSWDPNELKEFLTGLEPECFASERHTRFLTNFLLVACSKDELRVAAAELVIDRLRKAIASSRALAPHARIAEVLTAVDCADIVPLPPAASERYVLRRLAQAQNAPLCLHADWLPESAGLAEISSRRAAPLLAALEPLLSEDRNADAAGTAALALVKLMRRHLREALNDPDVATLSILRVGDGSGIPKLISLRDLSQSAVERRLFKSSPNVQKALRVMSDAVLNSGALIVGGDAARLLEEIGSPFSFSEGTKENFAALVLRTDEYGDAEARAKAMEVIVTQSHDARRGLRVLAVGDRRAGNESARIFALPYAAGRLDALALKLIEGSETDFLIPSAILDVLNPPQQRFLGIETMDGPSLGKLLSANIDALSRMDLDDDIVNALLESDVPDEDLCRLPIFPTEDGLNLPANKTWRSSSKWRVPDSLASVVHILKPTRTREASERLERLVRSWSPEAQIEAALAQSRPHEFVTEILNALERLTEAAPYRLQGTKWIPDNQGRAWTPTDVLDLPDEILDAARAVLGSGDYAAFVQLSDVRREVRDHPGFEKLRREHVLPDQSNSVDALLFMIDGAAPRARLGELQEQEAKAVGQLAELGADLALPGWPLLSALIRHTGKDSSELSSHFGLVTEKHFSEAISHVNALAKLAEEGKKAARTLYDSAFRTICNWRSEKLHEAMGGIRVPVQSGGWQIGSQVAARVQGIAPAHRLDERLDEYWPKPRIELDDQSRQGEESAPERRSLGELSREEKHCANSLVPLLKHAQAGVPPQLLALLVGVVRRSDPFKNIVCKELGLSETVIDQVWGRVEKALESASTLKTVLVNVNYVESHERVRLTSLSNKFVELPVGGLEPLLVIGNRHRNTTVVHQGGIYNHKTIDIAELEQQVDAKHVLRLLHTVLSECMAYRSEVVEKLTQLANDYKEIEQTTVRDAQARLEDRLPQILAELKPKRGTALREALDEYEKKEQQLKPGREREQKLPDFKRELWTKIQSPEESIQLLCAVRKQIEDYGYSPDRVLFELFQNADDASEQHEPPGRARFRLEVSETEVRALHWGRLINHPGPDPDKGEREGWLRDLFNMLLMNLSEKREGVTGRFGLGFKSVHLIAKEVSIASGFVACKVQGGILPEAWQDGRRLSLDKEDDGRRATAIQLSIDEDRQESAFAAVEAFSETARWLPAMARCIRSIELEGEISREWHAEYRPLSEDVDIVELSGSEPGRSLALELGEDTMLFLPLSSDGPTPAKEELPRLWLLAPLAETLKSGWLMNGRQFQVDPGRGSLKRGDGEPQGTLERLGMALGEKLIALADLIENDWAKFAAQTGLSDHSPETGPATFWTRLGELFALDLDDPLASRLHGPDRGYGRLIAERPVFPTRLPRPFTALLRASEARHAMHGLLSEPSLLADLRDWGTLDELSASCIGQRAADQLQKLGFSRPPTITLPVIVREEIGSEKRIDPVLADRLGRVLTKDRLEALDGREERHLLEVLSKSRFKMADDTWREARYSPRNASDADEEETRVLGFAPDGAVAKNEYRGDALSLYRLAMRQSGFQRTSETFAHWATAMSDEAQTKALLDYVLDGRQGTEVGKRLAKVRPSWLPLKVDELRTSHLVSDIAEDELPRLLGLLYPDEQRKRWAWDFVAEPFGSETDETQVHIDPSEFLEAVHSWWKKEHKEERQRANSSAYPEFFSPETLRDTSAEDNREEWFTFFALGIFRTIGRTFDSQHRSFIAAAHRDGWWKEMASAQLPSDPQPWVRQLEDMAHANAWKIDFPQWRRSLSDLYVLARWLPDYVDAFKTLPGVIRQGGHVALSEAWRLSSSPIWQRRGLEGAPLSQSLGLGANWMIREAVRHCIWTDENAIAMHPYGWASTARVRRLFNQYLDESIGENGQMDLSPRIYALIQEHLGDEAGFFGDLDLPLQILADERRSDKLQKILSDLGNANAFSEDYLDDEEAYG
ncbi:hypothetical protein RAZWK3B_14728 [Roseobacter sp. AzwK-3b]|uniref:sacsin N-terminal ATP-binding-like domain-containing protein n=1 Tax=Roseobacter sp. AzwK-3b TaxID=351016 RepID=UPI0001569C3C|nr:hypothetical protein [Roseobacter sp. AzwK-3b]EDM70661.1 hypothetical protein RAZWK3B_14728 [Roseobacter sp. AzwK-3b]